MQNAETLLAILRERGSKGLPIERMYRMLYNRELYLRAYAKLYPNKGAMTPGVTDETVDGMSLGKINSIIDAIKYERYKWSPVRRTYRKKANGKLRPLGLPTWKDKLLQEVIRSLLEAYYEPQFSKSSHGFRPQKGCHTALQEIQREWTGAKWFIEGDIAQYFDTIDHQQLLEILKGKIQDNRFLRLIQELLEAGYAENWKHNETYSGAPQGGVLSPILSNIYLDRFDKYVEKVLTPVYTNGKSRVENKEYRALRWQIAKARKNGKKQEVQKLKKQLHKLPSQDPNDPGYRRLRYVRYADDFLLGYIGTKQEAEGIKQQIGTFLEKELKLELSQEKTLVTNATKDAARFLNYEVVNQQSNTKFTNGRRSANGRIGLRVPKDITEKKCAQYLQAGKPVHLSYMLENSDYSIITEYQQKYSGIVQYYILAYNVRSLSRLKWTMEISLIKTLAWKYKSSLRKMYRKYEGVVQTPDGKMLKCLQVSIKREGKRPLVARFGGISLKRKPHAILYDQLPKPTNTRTEILQRLLADKCELCGSENDVEVHHIKKLSNLRKQGQKELTGWKALMAARQRKTLVVCKQCHTAIHAGNATNPRSELLESRVHGNM